MEAVDDLGTGYEAIPLPKRTARYDGRGENGDPLRTPKDTLLAYLRSKRYWILGCILLVCGLASLALYLNPVRYTSSVILVLREAAPSKQDDPGYMPDRSPNNARLSHLPTSTEMTDHLIGKYDLYGHYGINAAHQL